MEKEELIELYLLYIEEGTGWFVSHELGYLFEINLQTGKCSALAKVPPCYEEKKIYDVRYKKGELIYLFPDEKGSVFIYNLLYECFYEIKIFNDKRDISVKEVHVINDILYIICAGLRKIVELKKDKILNVYDINESITGYSVSIGQRIVCVSKECDVITEFDTQNGKTEYYLINEADKPGNIIYDGTKIWLSGYGSYIYTWDYLQHCIIDKIEIPKNLYFSMRKEEKQLLFQRIVCSENYIWFIPFCTNYFLYIHKEEKKINFLKIGQENELNLPGAWFRFISILENRYFLVSSIRQAKLFQVDMERAVVQERKVIIEEKKWKSLLDDFFYKEIVTEMYGVSILQNYISCISKSSYNLKEGQKEENGKEIYQDFSFKGDD